MTTSEAAGINPFITRGLEDPAGVYVGSLYGDVNSAAVMLDTFNFQKLALIGATGYTVSGDYVYRDTPKSSAWGLQFVQDHLLRGSHVHQIVLNDADLHLGTDLSSIEQVVNLDQGQLNVMEVFGKKEDELSLFSVQLEKMVLIVKLLNPEITAAELEILREQLEAFYVDQGLWLPDAQLHPHDVRLVGLPHNEYPRFELIHKYFEMQARTPGISSDDKRTMQMFQRMFNNLTRVQGNLFNVYTSFDTNRVATSPLATYSLAKINRHGEGVLMAQFVNAISYIIGNVEDGDLIMIHGADRITQAVWKWFSTQLKFLWNKDVHVVLAYDDFEAMFEVPIRDQNTLMIVGQMGKDAKDMFLDASSEPIPENIIDGLMSHDESVYYVQRGSESVLLKLDLSL